MFGGDSRLTVIGARRNGRRWPCMSKLTRVPRPGPDCWHTGACFLTQHEKHENFSGTSSHGDLWKSGCTMILVMLLVFWPSLAFLIIALVTLFLGHTVWAIVAFTVAAAAGAFRIPRVKDSYRVYKALTYSSRAKGFEAELWRMPHDFKEKVESIANLSDRVNFGGSEAEASQLRQLTNEMLSSLTWDNFPQTRKAVLVASAKADRAIYRTTRDLTFGEDAERALLEAVDIGGSEEIASRSTLQLHLLELYSLIYKFTEKSDYAAKLEAAYLAYESSLAEDDPSQYFLVNNGIGDLYLRMFRATGDLVHASAAEKRLINALHAAERLQGPLASWVGTFVRTDIFRLYELQYARTGDPRYEKNAAEIFFSGIRGIETEAGLDLPTSPGITADAGTSTAEENLTTAPKMPRMVRIIVIVIAVPFFPLILAYVVFRNFSKSGRREFREGKSKFKEVQQLTQQMAGARELGNDLPGVLQFERLRDLCADLLSNWYVKPVSGSAEWSVRGSRRTNLIFLNTALGRANAALYQFTGNDSYYTEAQHALKKALSFVVEADNPLAWADVNHAIGCVAARRYELTQEADCARHAIASFKAALSGAIAASVDSNAQAMIKSDLAQLYCALYTVTREETWAVMSEELIDSSLKGSDESAPKVRANLQLLAGSIHTQRYFEATLSDFEAALDLANYSETIRNHYERARTAFEAALTLLGRDSAPREWALAQLMLTSLEFLDSSRRPERDAGRLLIIEQDLKAVLAVVSEADPRVAGIWGMAQALLGNVYLALFEATGDNSYAEEAETRLQNAIAVSRQMAPDPKDSRYGRGVVAEFQLRKLYIAVAERQGRPDESALPLMAKVSADIRLLPFVPKVGIVCDLGDRYAARASWNDAHAAYQVALKFVNEEFDACRTGAERLILMDRWATLYAKDAHVLAQMGLAKEAFIQLDAGRARMLAERMRFDDAWMKIASDEDLRFSRRLLKIKFDNDIRIIESSLQADIKPSGYDGEWADSRRWRQAVTADRSGEKINDALYEEFITSLAKVGDAAKWQELVSGTEDNDVAEARLADAQSRFSDTLNRFRLGSLLVDALDDSPAEIARLNAVAPQQYVSAMSGIMRLQGIRRREFMEENTSGDWQSEISDLEELNIPPGCVAVMLVLEPEETFALVLRDGAVSLITMPDINTERFRNLIDSSLAVTELVSALAEAYSHGEGVAGRPKGNIRLTPDAQSRPLLDRLPEIIELNPLGWFGASDLMRLTRCFAHEEARYAAERAWHRIVGEVLEVIQEIVWAPLLDSVLLGGEVRSILLLPAGLATVLPVHAAAPVGLDVAYAPSLSVWRQCRRRAARASTESLFLANPAYGSTGLAYSELAEQWVKRNFPGRQVTVLHGAEASREAVCFGSAGHGIVHFHGHAYYRVDDPQKSAIVCSDGELALADVQIFMDLTASHLVVLSACSSAVTDIFRTGNEFIGLPAGFLQAGAPAVIASLWPVTESSTAFLMDRFYTLLRMTPGKSVAKTLHEATEWLRHASKADLLLRIAESNIADDVREALYDLLRTMSAVTAGRTLPQPRPDLNEPRSPVIYTLRAVEEIRDHPDDPPFASPIYWASFAAYGAVIE